MKKCRVCEIQKQESDYRMLSSGKFRTECKECEAEYNKKYKQANKEKVRAQTKAWKQDNKAHVQKYMKQYRFDNKEHISVMEKEHYKKNELKYKQNREIYVSKNKVKIAKSKKQWRLRNKELIRRQSLIRHKLVPEIKQSINQRYWARKKELPYTLTPDEWVKIKGDFNNSCAYCGITEEQHKSIFNEILHQEHFIPLSKGGEFSSDNIIPACKKCNGTKYNTDFFEWYPNYEHYSKERERFILEYLGYENNIQQLSIL